MGAMSPGLMGPPRVRDLVAALIPMALAAVQGATRFPEQPCHQISRPMGSLTSQMTKQEVEHQWVKGRFCICELLLSGNFCLHCSELLVGEMAVR